MSIKALILFSGGLDSLLAAKILLKQGISVTALCFKSSFYNCDKARVGAEQLKIELIEKDISDKMLELVKNPPSGYGKNLNPCIDCHSLMLRQACDIMKKGDYDIIASGEVLGQRPFSQNKEALGRVSRLAGVEILRPMSAKLLPETEYEKKGLVTRGKLKKIYGRQRDEQFELAKKYNIVDYPSPSGGCILTDIEFSNRMIKMLEHWPDCESKDVDILKHGRVFWFKVKNKKEHVLAVIGRHQEDNENLESLSQSEDGLLKLKDIEGPITLIRTKGCKLINENKEIKINAPIKKSEVEIEGAGSGEEILNRIGLLTAWYATKARGNEVCLEVKSIKS